MCVILLRRKLVQVRVKYHLSRSCHPMFDQWWRQSRNFPAYSLMAQRSSKVKGNVCLGKKNFWLNCSMRLDSTYAAQSWLQCFAHRHGCRCSRGSASFISFPVLQFIHIPYTHISAFLFNETPSSVPTDYLV